MERFEELECRVGDLAVHLRRTQRGGVPIVILHGLLGSGACLMPLARALDRFEVILPDARGHGRSDRPQAGYSYPQLASDAASLMEELALDRPILAGHSMGGLTAAVAAGHLGRGIRGLVLIDPTFISLEWQHQVYESDIAAEHRTLLSLTRDELVGQGRVRNPHRTPELLEALAEARLRTSERALEILRPPNPDFRELVRRIEVPTLLLLAEGGVVSVETALELQSSNPLLAFAMIPDCGHGLPYDRPGEVAAAITRFAPGEDGERVAASGR